MTKEFSTVVLDLNIRFCFVNDQELQMCQNGYPEMLEMYLRQIFIRLHRHFLSSVSHDNTHKADEIDNAVSYFSEHYNEPINIDSYAEQK